MIHIGLRKSASQTIREILASLLADRLTHIQLNELAFDTELPYFDNLDTRGFNKVQQYFKPQGYLYATYGKPLVYLNDKQSYKSVITIRDPRDILVSDFYSVKSTHFIPSNDTLKTQQLKKKRAQVQDMSIDDYVLQEASEVLEIFDLVSKYTSASSSLVLKYETFIDDFEIWLSTLIQYLDIEIANNRIDKARGIKYRSTPKTENEKSHQRKGQKNDFINKLQKSTILELDNIFGVVLQKYNYNPYTYA